MKFKIKQKISDLTREDRVQKAAEFVQKNCPTCNGTGKPGDKVSVDPEMIIEMHKLCNNAIGHLQYFRQKYHKTCDPYDCDDFKRNLYNTRWFQSHVDQIEHNVTPGDDGYIDDVTRDNKQVN